ncbi:hypothetical protein N7532_000650 [Penicillium argentinense]|uniref:Methyltransferase domain-containing protein n=1 Tax=Penicillium argentinense TaxID=1131581 RepID=A0A9W9KNI3_9EURO|nr:uncharacterized protein N7532_000650 [Penicillium argentinense]KAJ5112605.1 hypothetical protein N7532_000650 [Penicillium argentinense]
MLMSVTRIQRDRAFKVVRNPPHRSQLCTHPRNLTKGTLDLDLHLCPAYAEILERVKNGYQFLDLGCCFAQEVRLLVSDGAFSQNVFGVDLVEDFINLGYDLFLDKEKINAKFLVSNLFDTDSIVSKELTGKLDIIHASNFFHLWSWTKQIEASKAVVKLLADKPGSLIIGSQVGSKKSRMTTMPGLILTLFTQSVRTFKLMRGEILRDLGVDFEVKAFETEFLDKEAFMGGRRSLSFEVGFYGEECLVDTSYLGSGFLMR